MNSVLVLDLPPSISQTPPPHILESPPFLGSPTLQTHFPVDPSVPENKEQVHRILIRGGG